MHKKESKSHNVLIVKAEEFYKHFDFANFISVSSRLHLERWVNSKKHLIFFFYLIHGIKAFGKLAC